jgi:hypothetical protein
MPTQDYLAQRRSMANRFAQGTRMIGQGIIGPGRLARLAKAQQIDRQYWLVAKLIQYILPNIMIYPNTMNKDNNWSRYVVPIATYLGMQRIR